MSFFENLKNSIKAELAKPAFKAAVLALEHSCLEATKAALEALEPKPVAALAGGLLDRLAESGITKVEHATQEALDALGPIAVQVGQATMVLTAVPGLGTDSIHSVADLKAALARVVAQP